ncbi:MAG TPA: molecular chaperone DnaK [Candidatus Latescibacteria bacterium]|nr:molecular chaperone DnaK [Candidatus Latescibacterota bacterium]|tara:strand:+ start:1081 stop:1515 length:435 start_codon:yes stop_codon:yes gene_type:complete
MAKKLTKKKLAQFEKLLKQRKKELLKQALNQDEDIHELRGDHSADPLDMAGYASSLELMSTLGNNERVELAELDHALTKIEDRTYGICEDSGELISEVRLEAIPTARYTIECQEQRERNTAFTDRPRRRVLSSEDLPVSSDEDS